MQDDELSLHRILPRLPLSQAPKPDANGGCDGCWRRNSDGQACGFDLQIGQQFRLNQRRSHILIFTDPDTVCSTGNVYVEISRDGA
ncbi:MAG: hypothetical protein ACXIUW_06435 [Roseinatronobacter sp.]